MDQYTRHKRIFRFLGTVVSPIVRGVFHLDYEELQIDGPALIISNHVTSLDPVFVGLSLRKKHAYFVASEHLFRLGRKTALINRLFAPISRRKGSTGMDTVKACLRHLREGHSVCLFAEGEQSWDGRSSPVFQATGKLVKASAASLVTFRLEGAYLSFPRWGKHISRGRIRVHPVGVYSPETLQNMSAKEINALIQHDIHEDAWVRQRKEMVHYRGRRRAESMERLLYACPACKRIGTLSTEGDRIFCSCGFERHYTETCFFEPDTPFETLADWEDWQRELLRSRSFVRKDECLFSDSEAELTHILNGHSQESAATAELRQYEDRLVCGNYVFPLADITDMAMVQAHLLLLSCRGEYYQLRAGGCVNLKKYLDIWKES